MTDALRIRLQPRTLDPRPGWKLPFQIRRLGLFCCLVVGLLATAGCGSDSLPIAREGVLELGSYDFENDPILGLSGEWEFYWNRFYTRADFANPELADQLAAERTYIAVPEVWNEAKLRALAKRSDRNSEAQQPAAESDTNSSGYATLRLRIRKNGGLNFPEDLRLATRQWGLAYRLYCGDDLIFANGVIGSDESTSRPGRLPVAADLSPACYESGELIWQISNFHTALGGPRLPVLMGTHLRLNAHLFQKDLLSFVLAGVTLIIAVYHLVLWYFQRNERNHWRFGVLAIIILLWTGTNNDLVQRFLGEDAHYVEVLKFQLIALFLMPAAYYAYLQACYEREFPTKILPPLVIISLLFVFHNLLRPTMEVTRVLPVYLGLIAAVVFYSVIATGFAAVRGRPGALLTIGSCLVVLLGVVNDALVYLSVYRNIDLVQYGFFFFIISQSAVQAGIFSAAYKSADKTSRTLQIEVGKKMQELREANDKLRELDASRTAFFQNISHEFRTPLTLIKSPLEAAERRDEAISRDTQRVILSNARRLQRLVDQLLDLQKIAAGRLQIKPRAIELNEFVRLVTSAFEPYARIRGIQLSTEVEPDLPLILVDPEMLDKCLYNYLSNSLKFTAKDGRVTLRVLRDHGGARVEVRDTGVGLPAEQIPHLFTRFGYSRPSPVKDQAGSGLGLSLVKELIELHDGRVGVESEEGRGATFWFWLPPAPDGSVPDHISREAHRADFALTNADFEPAVPAVSSQPATRRGRGRAILIVEDNDDLRDYMRTIFDRQGYRVGEAADGQAGLEALPGFRPDLIITDLMLPRVSGIDMIGRIRKNPDYRTVPILLLTARADDQTKQEAHEAGADAYLPKPFDESELLAIIRNLLSLKAREKELELDLAQARRIQENLLPQSLPVVQGLRLASFYRPMDKVGGDLYDFIKMGDGSLGIFVGDVSGHGIPAALLASAVKMTLEAFGTRTYSPAELLKFMNESLYGRTADNFLSCSCGLILPDHRQLIYAQGGHPPAILIRDGQVNWHEAQGTWLGITPEVSFEEQTIDLQKGDRLILYTDGIVEAMNPGEEMFGEDRLAQSCLRYNRDPLKEQLENIVEEVFEFQGTGSVQDDITLIALEVVS
ncbi:MAG: SpoIIE family protein phosphatase [bacterium]|nr:SpoIIE family protein phosphatase [bacterium]